MNGTSPQNNSLGETEQDSAAGGKLDRMVPAGGTCRLRAAFRAHIWEKTSPMGAWISRSACASLGVGALLMTTSLSPLK